MDLHWHDLVGGVGVAIIVLTYLALQVGRLDARSLVYSTANALGALLVLVSLGFDFNLSAFVVEAFWMAISLLGLVRGLRSRAAPRRAASVSCYAGHRGDETPRRFTPGAGGPGSESTEVEVVAVEERWVEPDWRVFRVRGDDGRTYVLRQEVESGRWEVR